MESKSHSPSEQQSNTPQTLNRNKSSQAPINLLSPSLPQASPLGSSSTSPKSRASGSVVGAGDVDTRRQSDWWKWSTPSPEDIRSSRSTGGLELGSGGKRFKRSEEEFKMIGKWRVGKGIGKGTSGKVRIARHVVTGQYSAIKMVKRPLEFDLSKNPNAVQREITVMKLVESRFIVRLLDVFQTESHIYLVTEYCEIGELFHFFTNRRLSEELIHKLFSQLVTALSHLRIHSIAHRDIKFENLLIDSNYDLKLADFGMAIFCPRGSLLDTSCGSPHYAAPEVIAGIGYDGMRADLWSSGIVLYAMISRHLPFDNDNISTLLCQIKTGKYTMHPDIQGEARDLIERILIVDPSSRITLDSVISHPYLQIYGTYTPAPYDLPFPLSSTIAQEIPTTKAHLDMELIDQLRVVLRVKSIDEVVKLVLQNKGLSEAKTFYAILKNFRSRASTDEDVKAAVIDTANRVVLNPRRVKSADPILSRQSIIVSTSVVLPPSSYLEYRVRSSLAVLASDSPTLSTPRLNSRTSSNSTSDANESIVFPSFPTLAPEVSIETIIVGSPSARRSISLHENRESLPTLIPRIDSLRILHPEQQPTLSPRSKKFSMQKLKSYFAHPKVPSTGSPYEGNLIIAEVHQLEVVPLHVKRSTRISSFGKVIKRLSTSPLRESTPSKSVESRQSNESSPASPSSKLFRKKKSWARMEDSMLPGSPKSPASPNSPTSTKSLSKKKSWAWNNRPISWISNTDENSSSLPSPPPNSPRRISSQISTWFASSPASISSPSSNVSTPSTSPTTTAITKRRPSPLQLSNTTNERPASTFSLSKRIAPPPFLSRIQSSYETAPLTPEKTPTSPELNRPVFYTTVSESIYSERGEGEDDLNTGEGEIKVYRRSYSRTPSPNRIGCNSPTRNDGFLSPPLTAVTERNVSFLDYSMSPDQRSKQSSMRSYSSQGSIKREEKEGIRIEDMMEKILRLEEENRGLRLALERKTDRTGTNETKVENKENSIPSASKSILNKKLSSRPILGNHVKRIETPDVTEQDELVDMVGKLSFESDGIIEEKWLKMLGDSDFA